MSMGKTTVTGHLFNGFVSTARESSPILVQNHYETHLKYYFQRSHASMLSCYFVNTSRYIVDCWLSDRRPPRTTRRAWHSSTSASRRLTPPRVRTKYRGFVLQQGMNSIITLSLSTARGILYILK